MKRIAISYGRQAQSRDFIDNLYKGMKRKTSAAIAEHDKIITLARDYLDDGLESEECIELLMIEGSISREAAAGLLDTVQSENDDSKLDEYSFRFEDVNGKTWSSFDVGLTVRALDEEEAWQKAEEMIASIDSKIFEADSIIGVEKINKA
jgi:hypothetical protein